MDLYSSEEAGLKAIISAIENTNLCTFMYYPPTKTLVIPERTAVKYHVQTVYEDAANSFAEMHVYPGDYEVFKETYRKIDAGEQSASMVWRTKDLEIVNRVTMTTVRYDEAGHPLETIAIVEDVSKEYHNQQMLESLKERLSQSMEDEDEAKEVMPLIAGAIGDLYCAIYHLWVKTEKYICFQESMPGVLKAIGGVRGNYKDAWDNYIREYVVPEYQHTLTEFYNLETLKERLHNQNSISIVYRRLGIGWVRGTFIVAKRDVNGEIANVVFTVRDLNEEVELERKRKQAQYDAEHDSLTGVYNRKGMERILSKYREKILPMGYAMLDIDNFKGFNDIYGHNVGDKVLKEVTAVLSSYLRSEDCIFRIGGDEFAILLVDFQPEGWNTICRKLEGVHKTLHKAFPDQEEITLSVGICVSEYGYDDEMPGVADAALYETKRNGRSGATMMDVNHNVLEKWRDIQGSLQTDFVFSRNATGIFRIEEPTDCREEMRMICNDTSRMIFGFPKDASPEECCKLWLKGLDPEYLQLLIETKERMLNQEAAECVYEWHHPQWGVINIRSGGTGERLEGMDVTYGFHHALNDTVVITRKDDSQKIVDALNDSFFASIYVDLSDNSFRVVKCVDYVKKRLMDCRTASEGMETFINTVVDAGDKKQVSAFCEISTIAERLKGRQQMDCYYRSKVMRSWCRVVIMPVDYEEGQLKHALMVISKLDDSKAREIEENIINKRNIISLFNNVPAGIILYEWNGEELIALRTSQYYQDEYATMMTDGRPNFERVHPDDVLPLRQKIAHALTVTHELTCVFRVWSSDKRKYLWNKLDAVSDPQEDGTQLIYAIYTDVTAQKEAEQKLVHDATHDPLTDLYNRNMAYERCREVLDAHPEEQFVMVHFDYHHFHLYNTFYGEEAGNRLLCATADAFRWMDQDYDHWVYARIEADVFLAFFPYNEELFKKHIAYSLDLMDKYCDDFLLEPAIGMYFVQNRSLSIDAMFARAGIAARKTTGGMLNDIIVYNEEMEQQLVSEQQIVNDMQIALVQEQFKVYLQPKFSLRNNKPTGAEAFVRWFHPERGMISPAEFIPVFERNGFIADLDRYMWEHVCTLLARWRDEGRPLAPVSVNVSRLSMLSDKTVDFLKDVIARYELDPKYLQLELTETAYMDNPKDMLRHIGELRKLGFEILMDDFGAGYSSLNTLRNLPVDTIKLDLRFLSDKDDARGARVISSVVRMCKMLNLVVVAEGVEREEQAVFLRSIGVEYVQGFLFARPMPFRDYERNIMEHMDEAYVPEHVGKVDKVEHVLSDAASAGELMPVPVALMDVEEDKFSYLRVNKYFFDEFDMNNDLRLASVIFREHLDNDNFVKLTEAYRKCADTKQLVQFRMQWQGSNGQLREYVVKVSFAGEIGHTSVLIVAFVNITDL